MDLRKVSVQISESPSLHVLKAKTYSVSRRLTITEGVDWGRCNPEPRATHAQKIKAIKDLEPVFNADY